MSVEDGRHAKPDTPDPPSSSPLRVCFYCQSGLGRAYKGVSISRRLRASFACLRSSLHALSVSLLKSLSSARIIARATRRSSAPRRGVPSSELPGLCFSSILTVELMHPVIKPGIAAGVAGGLGGNYRRHPSLTLVATHAPPTCAPAGTHATMLPRVLSGSKTHTRWCIVLIKSGKVAKWQSCHFSVHAIRNDPFLVFLAT